MFVLINIQCTAVTRYTTPAQAMFDVGNSELGSSLYVSAWIPEMQQGAIGPHKVTWHAIIDGEMAMSGMAV